LLDAAREVGPCVRRAWVAVGPEGDWDADELGRFRRAGFRSVTLGGTVMRAETAALAAVVLARAALDGG
jgi:16S rRNA (uracil1498-N3)-methyltransferase